MRTILLLFAFLLSGQQDSANPNKQRPQENVNKPKANQAVSDAGQRSPETRPQAQGIEGQISTDNSKEYHRRETVKNVNDGLLVLFTGALVLVGFLQWRTLCQHEKWMKRNVTIARDSARAAQKAAEAAQNSVDAVKKSERAWLVIRPATFALEPANRFDWDSFGEQRESRFCYRYADFAGEFRINITAPPEYHRCT